MEFSITFNFPSDPLDPTVHCSARETEKFSDRTKSFVFFYHLTHMNVIMGDIHICLVV